jgi:hypothetical protein
VASTAGITIIIAGVSTAAAAGTAVIIAPLLASAYIAATAGFIGAYIIGELAAELQKAGLSKV